jgi:N6-L-threonylcarbamoyladenine synthase
MGDPQAIRFTLSRMKGNEFDFSFSGLKTAVLRWVERNNMDGEIIARRQFTREVARPSLQQWLSMTPKPTLDLIASFQSTVIQELLRRVVASAAKLGVESVIVSGGVASNQGLRQASRRFSEFAFYFPSPALSTDNAAMIAAAAFPKLRARDFSGFDFRAQANLPLVH